MEPLYTECKDCGGARAFYRRYGELDDGWLTLLCQRCINTVLKISAWMMHHSVVLGWDHTVWYRRAVRDHTKSPL